MSLLVLGLNHRTAPIEVRERIVFDALRLPGVLAELARLNDDYEERHGFRFVVFVNRRPKAEILEVLRVRIDNQTDEELQTALHELVAIAIDRWQRS